MWQATAKGQWLFTINKKFLSSKVFADIIATTRAGALGKAVSAQNAGFLFVCFCFCLSIYTWLAPSLTQQRTLYPVANKANWSNLSGPRGTSGKIKMLLQLHSQPLRQHGQEVPKRGSDDRFDLWFHDNLTNSYLWRILCKMTKAPEKQKLLQGYSILVLQHSMQFYMSFSGLLFTL